MSARARPLTFEAVDALAFAASRGMLKPANGIAPFQAASLGPLFEFFVLKSSGCVPAGTWIARGRMGPLLDALDEECPVWLHPSDQRMGFIRTHGASAQRREDLVGFLMDAKRAARNTTALPDSTAGQLVAAMEELEGNIHEHSGLVESGLLAFQAAGTVFEFVALDQGIGVLSSLRTCEAFAGLTSHGQALHMALTDGVSRYGQNSRHGHGFRPIFVGLANLRGSLRFRSGDSALTMDGTSPNLTTAQLAQKPYLKGLFISVSCFAA